jgi:hypothetical protein
VIEDATAGVQAARAAGMRYQLPFSAFLNCLSSFDDLVTK